MPNTAITSASCAVYGSGKESEYTGAQPSAGAQAALLGGAVLKEIVLTQGSHA